MKFFRVIEGQYLFWQNHEKLHAFYLGCVGAIRKDLELFSVFLVLHVIFSVFIFEYVCIE